MKRYNFILLLILLTGAFWLVINESFTLDSIGLALLLSIFILFITQFFVHDSELPDISISLSVNLLIYFVEVFFQIFKSSVSVSKAMIKGNKNIDRVYINLPTEHNLVNAIVCNTITATPGTITLEMKDDGTAEVLVLNMENKSKRKLQEEIEEGFKRLKDL